jgi:exopolyphosphatase/guanosine-5'-triphosphate,3'-diphosphate pyrophosphatase
VTASPAYASIDIGTNSALLLIASENVGEIPGGRVLAPLLQKVAAPRVGRGLSATGRISEQSFQALMAALSDFRAEIERLGARLVGAVATEAFRKASNGGPLLAQVSAALGCECKMLSGEVESRLGYLAVHNRHPLPGLAVLDVGGGSTEITTADGGISLPIGAVNLLETSGHDAVACRARARAAFAEQAALGGRPGEAYTGLWAGEAPENLIAVGGTATALAMLELGLTAFDAAAIEGAVISAEAVTRQLDRIAGLSESGRIALPGLGPGRADILMPGLCILESLLAEARCRSLRVSDRGIRYGVILEFLERLKNAN